jgi:murein DD-endopeptidase MepM/ murein hydrolase activator NlpD
MGIDLAVAPGSKVLSPTYGVLSKFGRCYRDTPEYRYVEITSQNGFRYRLFYVSPGMQQIGDTVAEGEDIGTAQDISARYPVPKGMKPHIHFEIKDRNGNYVNPKELVL